VVRWSDVQLGLHRVSDDFELHEDFIVLFKVESMKADMVFAVLKNIYCCI